MPTKVGGHHPMALFDRKQIATDLAFASEALAAAADALADAARAMSDATNTCGRTKDTTVSGGTLSISPTSTGVGIPTDIVPQDTPDRVGQHDLSCQRVKHQTDRGDSLLVVSTGSSVTQSESNLHNGLETITPVFPVHEASHPIIEDKPKLNNKLSLPLQPGIPSPNGNIDSLPKPTEGGGTSSSLSDVSRLLEAMKSYPTIPLGRNYISLDKAPDALAFIAYIALQVNKIICLIPDQYMNTCSELLKLLSRTNVYRVSTYHHFQEIYTELGTVPGPSSYYILLDPSLLSASLSKRIYPECFVHWGQPTKNKDHDALNSLPTSVKICVVLVGERRLNRRVQGVVPYSDEVLNTCFSQDSPFKQLCHISGQPVLPRASCPSPTSQFGRPSSAPSSNTIPPTLPHQKQVTRSTPPGNYYIVINTEQDRDIIPIITYIALNSKKVMCHVPGHKNLTTYKHLIELAYFETVILASMTLASTEAAVARLKLLKNGMLLRGAAKDWNSFLSDSLVDCLIYRGIPQVKLKRYCNECKNKVNHSYLILTRSEYSSIQSQLTSSQRIKEHPYIRASEISLPGSLLYDLQQRLLSQLPGFKNWPAAGSHRNA